MSTEDQAPEGSDAGVVLAKAGLGAVGLAFHIWLIYRFIKATRQIDQLAKRRHEARRAKKKGRR
jgi:hypothetical protein